MRPKLGAAALVVAMLATLFTAIKSSRPAPARQSRPVLAGGPTPPGVREGVLRTVLRKDVSAPIVGQLVTSTNGTWSNTPTSFTYVWRRCSGTGTRCVTINGATTSNYTISSGDIGHEIATQVTACSGSGCASQQSNPSGVVVSGGGSLLFDGTFESPVASGAPSPWAGGWQCANYTGQLGTSHYFGDTYFDHGGTTSPVSRQVNATFNAASSAAVPPFQGSYSGRIVLPAAPTGAGWTRTDCGMLPARTLDSSVQGIGHTMYYGLAVYLPAGETLSYNGFDGDTIMELHTNYLSSAPFSTGLHTGPTSFDGNTGNSIQVSIESGPCSGVHVCSYLSNPFHPNCRPTNTASSGSTPPSPSNPRCNLPNTYAIPPGQLQYGSWNRYVCGIKWETAPTGSVQCWYKNAGSGSNNNWVSTGAGISGIPTMQWSGTTGTSPPTGLSSYTDALYSYTGLLSRPFQMNFDNEVFGTTLSVVEAQLP